MLYREIIGVCSQIHTKHINTLCGKKVELLNVKLAVHIVTTGLFDRYTTVFFLATLPCQNPAEDLTEKPSYLQADNSLDSLHSAPCACVHP
jgi:hypothetical protein